MTHRKKTDKKSLEERVTQLEDILYRVLGAHGETYPGALADRDALGAPGDLGADVVTGDEAGEPQETLEA